MGILYDLSNFIIKNKLIVSGHTDYTDKVVALKEKIISSMPKELTHLEKSYYVYRELGKELSEHPANVFDIFNSKYLSLEPIKDDFQGNCKAIASLYVDILKDNRVGVDADLTIIQPTLGSHVDAVLKIDNKQYMTNLIADLSRIQTGQRTSYFGFDLEKNNNPMYTNLYKKRIKKCYKDMETIPRSTLDKLDKKFNYSCYSRSDKESETPGIYTEDVFQKLQEELQDPDTFKKYVLKGKDDVPEEDFLKHKLEFFFENMEKFSTYPGKNPNYLENIRYYVYQSLKRFFTSEESKRLNIYAVSPSFSDFSNIDSIIRLRTPKGDKVKSDYYIYVKDENTGRGKYKPISKVSLKKLFEHREILGEIDYSDPMDSSTLDL